jgi:hypothetical protein
MRIQSCAVYATLLLDLLTGSGFGAVVGLRHALEPDHFAAVATMVGTERSSLRAALLGIYWGLGHTLAIVVVGAALVLLQAEMPERASLIVDLIVSVMLVTLGVRALDQAARSGADSRATEALGGQSSDHARPLISRGGHWSRARRPMFVGTVHGLAGSGALTALVLTTLPSAVSRLAYVALFGLASTLAMAVMSGLLGWPLARMGTDHIAARSVIALVGVGSVALGLRVGNAALGLF